MRPFLYQVASLFYERYGAEVSRLAFVFPNRRTGLFFQKYLSEVADVPLFSPTILTINDLFVQLSGKQTADRIGMLFTLYDIYARRSGSDESFDEFLYWGEMLLNDFDDIDKYMANARKLFSNVSDLKAIEDDFDFLSEEQIEAIRGFWSSFYPRNDSPNQKEFLAVWEILYGLYEEFREKLATEGKGYEGMIFREVVERLEQGDAVKLPYGQIVFVGLNALSVSEERFLAQLQKRGVADFYWDYVSDKVRDPNNKASYFVARNLRSFPSLMELPKEDDVDTRIEVIGIPSGIGQAKQVYRLLDDLCREAEMKPEEALRTAVILPDEHLLLPVLNAIPEQIKRINVTMGYPLAGTPVAALIEYILELQKNVRYADRNPMFYYRDVLQILSHRYILSTDPGVITELEQEISRQNMIYVAPSVLERTPLLKYIFQPVSGVNDFTDYLIEVLENLNKIISSQVKDDEEETLRTNDLEQEFIFHYFATVNRMKEVMRDAGVEMKIDTFFRLLKRVTDTITIPFHGEPLSGLQIMGVLETRALDFDRLIILSMNEGIFPQRKVANSFIPYNLRRGFGLPTYEHQDSVWAYHFYRLLHRASQVSLLFDSRTDETKTGEVSRFVHQLNYHYEVPIQDKLVVYNVASSQTQPLLVPKRPDVMRKLNAYKKGGKKALSASAINTYLNCPLSFYFSNVEGVREEDEVTESIEANVFGSILHQVMEELYEPLCGKMVQADILRKIGKDEALLTGTIAKAFATNFFKSDVVHALTGQNYLIGEMIRKYVKMILEHDAKLTPFTYLASEKDVKGLVSLSDHSEVCLKGFIDRIDEVDGRIRIIDYKTGHVEFTYSTLESLFDGMDKGRPKAVMQVFLYCWLFEHLVENKGKEIQPGLYFVRSLFGDSFNTSVVCKDGKDSYKVESFAGLSEKYEDELRGCLDEMFDPEIPFRQTTIEDHCGYCPFRSLCGK